MNLKAKIGPLPAYAWGLILGGLAAIYIWYSRRNTAVTDDTDTTPVASATDDLSSAFNTEGVGSTVEPASDDTTDTTDTTTQSNAWWETQAVAYAASLGVAPTTAQRAIENYLNGTANTAADTATINKIITKLGLPPEGTAGAPSVIATPAAPKPAPLDYETKLSVRSVADNTTSAHVTFAIAWTKPPDPNNTQIDSGKIVVSRGGKTVATSGAVRGGTAVALISGKNYPPKGQTYTYSARYSTTGKTLPSSTNFVITGK